MSTRNPDLVQKPRDVFINEVLTPAIRIVEAIIFSVNYKTDPRGAVRPLRGILLSLTKESKTTMQKYIDRLTVMDNNAHIGSREEIEEIYSATMDFMHTTYLKEYERGVTDKDFQTLENEATE